MIGLVMLIAATDARPTRIFGGNDLYTQVCAPKGDELACDMYVAGVVEGLMVSAAVVGAPAPFCPPDGVTVGQLGDIFRKQLRDDPEHRNLWGSTLVLGTMKRAFPCPS